MICCNNALAKLKMKREGCRVIIQGFGNVGSQAALLMHAAGYKIIGVADIHGGLYNENGFDVPKLVDWVYTQPETAAGISRGRRQNDGAGSSLSPCDILVPAATENQITSHNAQPRGL
jgi:glutamate dehydrogenase (NAD(P)+)